MPQHDLLVCAMGYMDIRHNTLALAACLGGAVVHSIHVGT
jgi:hypothetical protein